MSISSEKKLKSLSFGLEEPIRPISGSKELSDLRADVEDAFVALEGQVSMPRITKVTGTVTDSTIGTTSLDITGVNFLAGRTQASLAVGTSTAMVTFTAVRPGEDGNDIQVEFIDPEANSQSLDVSVADNVITVTLATSNVGAITSTGNSITSAVNADADAKQLVKAVSGGAGVVIAHEAANLAGGTGRGLIVYVGGTAVALDDKVTNTAISVLNGQASTFSAGDIIQVEVKSHTVLTPGVTLTVLAD